MRIIRKVACTRYMLRESILKLGKSSLISDWYHACMKTPYAYPRDILSMDLYIVYRFFQPLIYVTLVTLSALNLEFCGYVFFWGSFLDRSRIFQNTKLGSSFGILIAPSKSDFLRPLRRIFLRSIRFSSFLSVIASTDFGDSGTDSRLEIPKPHVFTTPYARAHAKAKNVAVT